LVVRVFVRGHGLGVLDLEDFIAPSLRALVRVVVSPARGHGETRHEMLASSGAVLLRGRFNRRGLSRRDERGDFVSVAVGGRAALSG